MNPSNNTLSILNSPNPHQQSGRIGGGSGNIHHLQHHQQQYQTSNNINILQGLTRSQLAPPSHYSTYPHQAPPQPQVQQQTPIAEMANILPPPPFYFSEKVGHLNWKMVDQTNPNQLASTLDINQLSSLIQNITYAKLEASDLQKLKDPNLIKIFKLYQLSIEYLLYIQNYYASVAKAKDNQYQMTYQRSVDIEDQVKQQAKVISSIKQEIEYKKKHLVVYEQLMKMSTERNIRPVRCKLCEGKYFANQKYLNEHNKRRHKKFLKSTGDQQDDDDDDEEDQRKKVDDDDDINQRKKKSTKPVASIQQGEIVLKTEKQERVDLAREKQAMQQELRQTANNLVAEKMNPLQQRILKLNNERANQKQAIDNLMQKLNQIEHRKQEEQLIRKQENQQHRKRELQTVTNQMKKLQNDLQAFKGQIATSQKENVQAQVLRLKNQLQQRQQNIRQMEINHEQKQNKNKVRAEQEKSNQLQSMKLLIQKNFDEVSQRNKLEMQAKIQEIERERMAQQAKVMQEQKEKDKAIQEYEKNLRLISSELTELKKAQNEKPVVQQSGNVNKDDQARVRAKQREQLELINKMKEEFNKKYQEQKIQNNQLKRQVQQIASQKQQKKRRDQSQEVQEQSKRKLKEKRRSIEQEKKQQRKARQDPANLINSLIIKENDIKQTQGKFVGDYNGEGAQKPTRSLENNRGNKRELIKQQQQEHPPPPSKQIDFEKIMSEQNKTPQRPSPKVDKRKQADDKRNEQNKKKRDADKKYIEQKQKSRKQIEDQKRRQQIKRDNQKKNKEKQDQKKRKEIQDAKKKKQIQDQKREKERAEEQKIEADRVKLQKKQAQQKKKKEEHDKKLQEQAKKKDKKKKDNKIGKKNQEVQKEQEEFKALIKEEQKKKDKKQDVKKQDDQKQDNSDLIRKPQQQKNHHPQEQQKKSLQDQQHKKKGKAKKGLGSALSPSTPRKSRKDLEQEKFNIEELQKSEIKKIISKNTQSRKQRIDQLNDKQLRDLQFELQKKLQRANNYAEIDKQIDRDTKILKERSKSAKNRKGNIRNASP